MTTHAISWFEIPVSDFDRAKKFYSAIFDFEMPEMDMGGVQMGFFLSDQQNGGIGGCIAKSEQHQTTDKGAKVYLNAGSDLNNVLNRVESAGGKIKIPKTDIGQGFGFFATFNDTEGNEVSLHSMQ